MDISILLKKKKNQNLTKFNSENLTRSKFVHSLILQYINFNRDVNVQGSSFHFIFVNGPHDFDTDLIILFYSAAIRERD